MCALHMEAEKLTRTENNPMKRWLIIFALMATGYGSECTDANAKPQ